MGFLDNAGDIILDAVLTNKGRKAIAKGDGSFNVKYFALGDDEIDYGLYNKNHPSGSSFYDLDILQTPVLEAFTNPDASLKSRLVSMDDNHRLYWPEIILRADAGNTSPYSTGAFVVAADQSTWEALTSTDGIMPGYKPVKSLNHIRLEQGLNTVAVPKDSTLDLELVETQWRVQMDRRLIQIAPNPSMTTTTSTAGTTVSFPNAKPSFVSQNNIATYFFTLGGTRGGSSGYITNCAEDSGLAGPGGTKLQFRLGSTLETQTSTYLFDTLGRTVASWGSGITTAQTINTVITIEGLTTRARIDVDVTLLKKV